MCRRCNLAKEMSCYILHSRHAMLAEGYVALALCIPIIPGNDNDNDDNNDNDNKMTTITIITLITITIAIVIII